MTMAALSEERAELYRRSFFSPSFKPMTDQGAKAMATREKNAALRSDRNFQRSLFRYGAKHGLPNLSCLQCITELRLLDRILDDDLALADKIEAEFLLPGLPDLERSTFRQQAETTILPTEIHRPKPTAPSRRGV